MSEYTLLFAVRATLLTLIGRTHESLSADERREVSAMCHAIVEIEPGIDGSDEIAVYAALVGLTQPATRPADPAAYAHLN